MSQLSGIRNSYVLKFGVGVGLVAVAVVAAGVNVYTNLAPQLSPDVRSQLLSGLVSVFLVFVVGVLFLAAALGREALSSLTVLTDRARQIERGNLDANLETGRNDELGELYRSFAAMRDVLRGRIRETERRNRQLQRTASEYSDVMDAVGDGDLSRRLDEDAEIDAMADLAREFNEMMDQLERTVGEVYAFTDEVARATDTLSRQTEESMRASVRVHRAASDIAGDTGRSPEQFAAVEDRIDTASEIEVADSAVEVDDTLDAIDGLSERMDRIDEISEFISDVANETNMLALNAGIEASKVDGDGAEGFQIVAEEVKNLAEETKSSTDEIETITDDIRDGTNDAVESILTQQAALLSMMDERVADLADTSEDLRLSISQLDVSEVPDTDVSVDRRALGEPTQD